MHASKQTSLITTLARKPVDTGGSGSVWIEDYNAFLEAQPYLKRPTVAIAATSNSYYLLATRSVFC